MTHFICSFFGAWGLYLSFFYSASKLFQSLGNYRILILIHRKEIMNLIVLPLNHHTFCRQTVYLKGCFNSSEVLIVGLLYHCVQHCFIPKLDSPQNGFIQFMKIMVKMYFELCREKCEYIWPDLHLTYFPFRRNLHCVSLDGKNWCEHTYVEIFLSNKMTVVEQRNNQELTRQDFGWISCWQLPLALTYSPSLLLQTAWGFCIYLILFNYIPFVSIFNSMSQTWHLFFCEQDPQLIMVTPYSQWKILIKFKILANCKGST